MANREVSEAEKGTVDFAARVISETVLATEGVASLLPVPPIHKGVIVTNLFGNVEVEIFVVVDYGVNIPELSWEIQERVKDAFAEQTSLTASHINIHIEGVDLSNVRKKEQAL